MERKIIASLMSVMMFVSMFFLIRIVATHSIERRGETQWAAVSQNEIEREEEAVDPEQEKALPEWNGEVIAIDPGHGGSDPGKIGVNDVEEKEINLAIAKVLQQKFLDAGYHVVMTREDDRVLEEGEEFDEESGKAADMRKRVDIINASKAKVMVSIHQNSFEMPEIKGPQVFYYETSQQGLKLAETIQNQLDTELAVEHPRPITPNNNYYLLHKSEPASVIVECGFLSNPEEGVKLCDPEYQAQLADIIFRAVDSYYKEEAN